MKIALVAGALALGVLAGQAQARSDNDKMLSDETRMVMIHGVQTPVHVMRMANGKTLYGFVQSDIDRVFDMQTKKFSTYSP
jgi:hypothetical protein